MSARFVVFLALRYLGSWKRQTAIIVAVVAGAAFLYALTQALLNGLEAATLEKTLGLAVPHVEVEAGDYGEVAKALEGEEEVVAAYSPRLAVNALAVRGGVAEGVRLLGVLEREEAEASGLDGYVVEGSWALSGRRCVLGARLASRLGVGVGDEISVVAPSGSSVRVRVAGVFYTGVFELDSRVVVCDLGLVEELAGGGLNYTVAVRLRDPSLAEEVAARLRSRGFEARPWTELAGNVLRLLEVERFYSSAIVACVLAITGLGIVNVMLMLTESRKRSIGVLKAIGATSGEVFAIYSLVALAYGVAGYALGMAAAATAASILRRVSVEIFSGELTVPFVLTPELAASALAFVVLLSVASCAYSAYKASRVRPAEVLRFE